MSPRKAEPGPEIEFASIVKTEKLHFREPPHAVVTFDGEPGERSVKHSRRVNLPESVEAHVNYRKVHVEYGFEVNIDLSDEAEN
jgi:hypothetical protein